MISEWFTTATPTQVERLVQAWPGAPEDQDEILEMLLDVAREQVQAFAPKDANGNVQPNGRLVYAQLQQAQNLWNAGRANGEGDVGPQGYSFTPRPLDKNIRAIIRPTSGVPDVL